MFLPPKRIQYHHVHGTLVPATQVAQTGRTVVERGPAAMTAQLGRPCVTAYDFHVPQLSLDTPAMEAVLYKIQIHRANILAHPSACSRTPAELVKK